MNYTVTPQTGRYLVQRPNGKSLVTRVVTKDKECSCGGNAEYPCEHIEAVKRYILDGGEKAKDRPVVEVDEPARPDMIEVCPVCGAEAKREGFEQWRCTENNIHYWMWLAERKHVREFFTERPTGIPAIDSLEDYEDWLVERCGYDKQAGPKAR